MADDHSRIQYIMADSAVNAIIEASTNGGHATRESFVMAIRAAFSAGAEYDAKHGGWKTRMERNFNSANDEEKAR